jgi:predicted transcriptional regulator
MSTAKDVIIKIVKEQPDDSNFDEILKELAFIQMVDRGLADSDAGRIVSHEEMGKRIKSWQK